jgi:hypothetical protein
VVAHPAFVADQTYAGAQVLRPVHHHSLRTGRSQRPNRAVPGRNSTTWLPLLPWLWLIRILPLRQFRFRGNGQSPQVILAPIQAESRLNKESEGRGLLLTAIERGDLRTRHSQSHRDGNALVMAEG